MKTHGNAPAQTPVMIAVAYAPASQKSWIVPNVVNVKMFASATSTAPNYSTANTRARPEGTGRGAAGGERGGGGGGGGLLNLLP